MKYLRSGNFKKKEIYLTHRSRSSRARSGWWWWPSYWQSPKMEQCITQQETGSTYEPVFLLVPLFLESHHYSIMGAPPLQCHIFLITSKGLPINTIVTLNFHFPFFFWDRVSLIYTNWPWTQGPPVSSLAFYLLNMSQWQLNFNEWTLGKHAQIISKQ
jgi:hypothetical protein